MLFKKKDKNKKSSNNINLDTLDVKAKKKKTLLIVGVFLVLMVVIFASIASTILTLQKKKVYKKRIANKIPKEIQVIQSPEMKESWAISVENRLSDQSKEIKQIKENLKNNKQDIINALREELKKNNEAINKKMDALSKTVTVQMKESSQRLEKEINSLKEENRIIKMKLKQLESLKNLKFNQNKQNEIVIGKNLLPQLPKTPKTKGGTNLTGNSVTIIMPTLKNKINEESNNTKLNNMQVTKKQNNVNTPVKENQLQKENKSQIENKIVKKEEQKPKIINHKKNIKIVSIDTSFNSSIVAMQNQIEQENQQLQKQIAKKEEIPNSFHVSIGFTQAYMITGAYAPTFQNSQTNPLPVLLEAEGNVLMANDTEGSIDKCFLLGSAKGNINSQTVSIKLVSISCLVDDGKYRIEGPISGWVIGENGMPGIPGEMLHKNGAWIAKTFIAGFLQTFSQAITGQTQPIVIGTQGGQTTNVGQAVAQNTAYAAATGLSTVFGKLGDYYLKMAEQIFPVIEVKAGRTVDIMLLGGENLHVVKNTPMSIANVLKYIENKEETKQRNKTIMMQNQQLNSNPFARAIANGSNIQTENTSNTGIKAPNGVDIKIPVGK